MPAARAGSNTAPGTILRLGQLPAHHPAFATTVYKAQGAQLDAVARVLAEANAG